MSRDYEDYGQNAERLMAYATEPALLDRVAQLEVLLGDVVRAAVSLLTATATCHGLGTPKAVDRYGQALERASARAAQVASEWANLALPGVNGTGQLALADTDAEADEDIGISTICAEQLLTAYTRRGPHGLARALYLTPAQARTLLAAVAKPAAADAQETTHA